jgi:hypothetical protein
MLRYRAWAAAVALGAGALAYAADPPAPRSGVRAAGGAPKTASVTPPSALPAETVQAALKAEYEAWERRVGVCLRLRQIALDKNDEALMRQADELEQRANALYQARASYSALSAACTVSAGSALGGVTDAVFGAPPAARTPERGAGGSAA